MNRFVGKLRNAHLAERFDEEGVALPEHFRQDDLLWPVRTTSREHFVPKIALEAILPVRTSSIAFAHGR